MEEQLRRSYGTGNPFIENEQVVDEIRVKKPFYRRSLFKNAARALFITTALTVGGISLDKRIEQNELRNQTKQENYQIQDFIESKEFRELQEDLERFSFKTIDFITNQPDQAHTVIPTVVNFEKENNKPTWTYLVPPVDMDKYSPVQLRDYSRKISKMLHERGYNLSDTSRGKYILLGLISQCRQRYVKSNPDKQLPQEFTLEMRETIGSALAKRFGEGTTRADVERIALLCSNFGKSASAYKDSQQKSKFGKLKI